MLIRRKTITFAVLLSFVTILCPSLFADDIAQLAPADTVFIIGTNNFTQLSENFQQTSTYAMYTDPAMAAFFNDAEQKITEKLQEEFAQILPDMPEEIPWPQGQAAVMIRMIEATETIMSLPEDFDYEKMTENDWANIESMMVEEEITTPKPVMVTWADMGDNLEELQNIIDQSVSQAVNQGAVVERDFFGDTEIITILSEQDSEAAQPEPFYYGFVDNTVIVASDLDFLHEALRRMDGIGEPGLTANPNYQRIMNQIGTGNIVLYANIADFFSNMATQAPQAQREQYERMIEAMGYYDINGIGASINVGVSSAEEVVIKAMLGVDDPRKGLIDMITPTSANVRLNRLLTAGLESFVIANYDLASIYDTLAEMVQMMFGETPYNPMAMIEGMLAMTGDPARGLPPVSIRDDILAQLSWPLVFMSQPQHEDGNLTSEQFCAIAVRDSQSLDTTLRRVHSVLFARGNTDLQRDFLNNTIYIVNLPAAMGGAMPSQSKGNQPAQPQIAFTVADDYLVIGSENAVEQAIRNLQRDDLESITTDQMFQYARRFLPARAGVVFYQNDEISSEIAWNEFVKLAEMEDDGSDVDISMMPSANMGFEILKDFCDLSLLPDFEQVREYCGASLGHVISIDDGIYIEMRSLNGPNFSNDDN